MNERKRVSPKKSLPNSQQRLSNHSVSSVYEGTCTFPYGGKTSDKYCWTSLLDILLQNKAIFMKNCLSLFI